jgi:uncharacterized RDD family membrane protein YckC
MTEVPPPAPEHQPPPAGTGGEYPGELLDRFLARLIDTVILIAVNAVIVGAIIVGVVMGETGGYVYTPGASFAVGAISAVISTALYLGYYAYMESSRGQTVGKMLLKLRTYGPDGRSNPTMEQALRRNIWAGFGILGVVPFLGFIGGIAQLVAVIMIAVGINSDPINRQAWHDRFAGGTQVRKLPG